MRIRAKLGVVGLGLSVLLNAAGCQFSKQAQLESVAKDWCLTIRASQVIPVYPLTEDLQPGDVFLVTVPVDRQHELYDAKGYLALDNHIGRIDPNGYQDFYDHSFLPQQNGAASPSVLPKDWIRPLDGVSWQPSPHAAFPSYSFSVRRGGGLSVAVPLHGVPVGLSLLGSDSANGTISIRKAQTMGVDTISLYRQLQGWAAENADFLSSFARNSEKDRQNYLRVVTRVYATGEMDVFLSDASAAAAGADVGAPKPLELLKATPAERDNAGNSDPRKTTVADYAKGIEAINESVGKSAEMPMVDGKPTLLPGGSLRVTAAAGRTVSLNEKFEKPLVLGYLAFDVTIGPRGTLGRPIPTLALIDSTSGVKVDAADAAVHRGIVSMDVYNAITDDPSPEARRIVARLDALAAKVPPTSTTVYVFDPATGLIANEVKAGATNFAEYRAYRGRLNTSIRSLEMALAAKNGFGFKVGTGEPEQVKPGSSRHVELGRNLAALKAVAADVDRGREESSATDAALAYYLARP